MSSNRNLNLQELTQPEAEALDIIRRGNALVKVLNDNHRDFITDQLADPSHNRPSRSLYFYHHGGRAAGGDWDIERPKSVKKINPLTFEVHDHEFGVCHEPSHDPDYKFTKKTAVSWIPSEPQYMSLFSQAGHIALLWDKDICDLKGNRYMFSSGGDTDWCWWLDVRQTSSTSEDAYEKSRKTIELIKTQYRSQPEVLKKKNDEAVAAKDTIFWNECLVGLPARHANAVVHVVDHRDENPNSNLRDEPAYRLETWNFMLELKKKFGMTEDIPVLIISDTAPVRVYTAKEREQDLKQISGIGNKSTLGSFAMFSANNPVKLDASNQQHLVIKLKKKNEVSESTQGSHLVVRL